MTQLSQEFIIDAAIIQSDRLEQAYNMTQMVLEFSLFEDIELPYISGQIVFMDDAGSFNEMQLKGTETLYVSVRGAEEGNENSRINIKMNIVSIEKKVKTTERTEVYHLSLMSPMAFRDQGIKLSKSFVGKLDEISANILQNYLDLDVSYDYTSLTTSQSAVKVITPYISPLESAKWLIDRATTVRGAPFFLWSSVYEQNGKETVRVGDLETMMTREQPWNAGNPLTYTQSGANDVALKDTAEQKRIIKSFVTNNMENTVQNMNDGAVGALFSTLDTYTSQDYSRHFAVSQLLEQEKTYLYTNTQNVHDDTLMLSYRGEERKLDEWDHRHFNLITSYGTYGSWNSYHDDPKQLNAMNKMRSNSIRSLLYRNAVDMTLAGSTFFGPMNEGNPIGVGAGDVTEVEVIMSDTNLEEPQRDKNLSGNYMILKCRHVFANTTHTVHATMSKLDGKQ